MEELNRLTLIFAPYRACGTTFSTLSIRPGLEHYAVHGHNAPLLPNTAVLDIENKDVVSIGI